VCRWRARRDSNSWPL